MKKTQRKPPKLQLQRETLAILRDQEAKAARGASAASTGTCINCTSDIYVSCLLPPLY